MKSGSTECLFKIVRQNKNIGMRPACRQIATRTKRRGKSLAPSPERTHRGGQAGDAWTVTQRRLPAPLTVPAQALAVVPGRQEGRLSIGPPSPFNKKRRPSPEYKPLVDAGWQGCRRDVCRAAVGRQWSMGAKPDHALCLDALGMACEQRRTEAGLIHHTDRGATYSARLP